MRRSLAPAVALLLLALTPVAAQDKVAPAAPPPRPPAPAPPAIPVPEVAQRAEEAMARLRSLETRVAASPDLDVIEQRLPEITTRIDRQLPETSATLESQPPMEALDGLAQPWEATRLELTRWIEVLTRRATQLEVDLAGLKETRETWTRSRTEARASRVPTPVIARIDAVLAGLDAWRPRLETRRASLLLLQDRVAREMTRCEEALASVARVRQGLAGRLLVRDRPPIWSREVLERVLAEMPGRIRDSARADAAEIRRFVVEQRSRLVLQLVVLLGLGLLLRGARQRTRRWIEADPQVAGVGKVFDRPWSAAVVVVLIASYWLYPRPPRAVAALGQLVVLVPLIRLMRPLVAPRMVPWLDALALFFVVDRLRNLVSEVPLLEHGLFALQMLAGAVALLRAIEVHRRQSAAAPDGGVPVRERALWLLAHVALLVFVVALVAVLVGYLGLARLLGSAVISGGYVALALYAGLRVCAGLVAYLLRVRPLRLLRVVERHRPRLERRILGVLGWLAVAGWAVATLDHLALLKPVLAAGQAVLNAGLTRGSISVSVGDVLAFAVTVWLAFVVSTLLRFVLEEDVYPRVALPTGMSYALSSVLHYVILLGGFVTGVAALGVDLTRVTILVGAFGVGIGFGLQNVVNNFVSGLIVLFERPVRVGDVVQLGDVGGEVWRIGIRSSTVRTAEGAEVIVPNAMLVSEKVTNWTLSDRMRRADVAVGVAYGTPPDKVLDVMRAVARAHPDVAAYPAPLVLFQGFGAIALQFELRVWTTRMERLPEMRSELGVALYAALREAGMDIPLAPHEAGPRSAPAAGA